MFDLFSECPTITDQASVKYPAIRARRAELKAAGGAEYRALREREKASKKRHYAKFGGKNRKTFPFKTALCAGARQRGRERGLEATITPADLIWPTHCPVLGVALDYPKRTGERSGIARRDNWPSLDRWDNTKGYVPGNVFVISLRANTLKNDATYEEILKVAKYLSRRP